MKERELMDRTRLSDYTPLSEMTTTCEGRAYYAEPGFESKIFLDRLKRGITDLHKLLPRALIFTQTSAANRAFLIKEAFRTAFSDDEMPVFLTVNPKSIRYSRSSKKVDGLAREIKQKLIRYGISEGEIVVIDEFPMDDGPPIKDGRGRYEDPRSGSSLKIATDIVRKAASSINSKIKVHSYNFMPLSQWNPNLTYGPWIKYYDGTSRDRQYSQAKTPSEIETSQRNIAYLRTLGKRIGADIRKAQKRFCLENKVVLWITPLGLISGAIIFSAGITGNVIGSLNKTSSNWIGGVLFIIGLVAAMIYFKRRR